jgi:hypothetical protein
MVRQVTTGTPQNQFHWFSYYDVPVWDSSSRYLAVQQVTLEGRRPDAQDVMRIGVLDTQQSDSVKWVGESRAWSWQQGALTQWMPDGNRIVWNDREGDTFVSRICEVETGQTSSVPRPIYAITPDGRTALTLDFARLNEARPGYGYGGIADSHAAERIAAGEGVWSVDIATGRRQLIVPMDVAVRLIFRTGHLLKPYARYVRDRLRRLTGGRGQVNASYRAASSPLAPFKFWFNHIKISPNGRRFTFKCRFRHAYQDTFHTVSLTCGIDGSDLRVLIDNTSHVMWKDDEHLHLWRDGLQLYRDTPSGGRHVRQIAPELIKRDVHARYLPGQPTRLLYDRPYGETVPLYVFDEDSGKNTQYAEFSNHRPAVGEFRCDLHPNPSPDGSMAAVNSLQDGGRQIYLIELS